MLDRLEPFHPEFSVENHAIMYPFQQNETVPTWALGVIVVIIPVILIVGVGYGIKRSIHDVHNGILGLLVSVLLSTIFTQVMKALC
ncbi:hypothetical protein BGZ65_001899 [Modicella reniformis]|uniref:Uncharacterized protein n=1 Tax=Modicella reniformis TaxID=1440133 RepID=A0A9P6MBF1_9FUNG|nr:hypothetical protein BGZ65_001899 [Modicella reniformis]